MSKRKIAEEFGDREFSSLNVTGEPSQIAHSLIAYIDVAPYFPAHTVSTMARMQSLNCRTATPLDQPRILNEISSDAVGSGGVDALLRFGRITNCSHVVGWWSRGDKRFFGGEIAATAISNDLSDRVHSGVAWDGPLILRSNGEIFEITLSNVLNSAIKYSALGNLFRKIH